MIEPERNFFNEKSTYVDEKTLESGQKRLENDIIMEFTMKFDEKGLRKWLEEMNLRDYYTRIPKKPQN